jgi:type IV pilus assembly protein PilX
MNDGGKDQREKGAALVVSNVVLMVLTMMAVIGMGTSILQERMTGNLADREFAFRTAEDALRAAEEFLTDDALPPFDGTDGLYPASLGVLAGLDWSVDDSREAPGEHYGTRDSPRYVIEELPMQPASEDLLLPDEAPPEDRFFRITSRGVGSTQSSAVILQSTFKKYDSPLGGGQSGRQSWRQIR